MIKKMHSIGWHKISLPKDLGGLGLMNLEIKNVTVLAKWRWKLIRDRKHLWNKVILGKYGKEIIYQARSQDVISRKLSRFMQNLLSRTSDALHGSVLGNEFHWKVRDGSLIDFWMDKWHISGVIADQFGSLFDLENSAAYKILRIDGNLGE